MAALGSVSCPQTICMSPLGESHGCI